MSKANPAAQPPSELIDQYIENIGDWRGAALARIRQTILSADPEMLEEWKWMGSPVWEREGIIAVGNAHKGKVKLTFAHGAALPDPKGLFNGNDTGSTRRSMDIFEDSTIDESALQDLVRAAIARNISARKK